jgi:hypothetical protein
LAASASGSVDVSLASASAAALVELASIALCSLFHARSLITFSLYFFLSFLGARPFSSSLHIALSRARD